MCFSTSLTLVSQIKSTKTPLGIYSPPLTPHPCFCWTIKIFPDLPIKTLTLFFDYHISYPSSLSDDLSTRFIIFLVSLYLFPPLENSITPFHPKTPKRDYYMLWRAHNPHMKIKLIKRENSWAETTIPLATS